MTGVLISHCYAEKYMSAFRNRKVEDEVLTNAQPLPLKIHPMHSTRCLCRAVARNYSHVYPFCDEISVQDKSVMIS